MKKLLLLFPLALCVHAKAQFALNGTSYTQNFNGIATGLPAGWYVDTASTATKLGTHVSFDGTPIRWDDVKGAYKNFAAATGLTAGADSAGQAGNTNRALGLRQVSNSASSLKNTDSGGAFVFRIAQTVGLSNFQLSFKLQSLDSSSPRQTTWRVDYGFGTTPSTFTAATATGTLTTGNKAFSNNTVNVNFGSALNNQSGNVWIRVVTVVASTGSGNRPSTAIDDYSLTWTGTANSIKESETLINKVEMFPNPNDGNFTVRATVKSAEAFLEVVNIAGSVIRSEKVNVVNGLLSKNISLEGAAKGVYFLRITAGNSAKAFRFVHK